MGSICPALMLLPSPPRLRMDEFQWFLIALSVLSQNSHTHS
jgi:hypothetical protein